MIDKQVTWVIAADGAQARLFEEPRRAGALQERPDWTMRQEPGDWPRAQSHATTVHQRTGSGRHADKETKPRQEAERRFLLRVADQLKAAALDHRFDRLVLMAPPRALGVLRAALPPTVLALVEASDPHTRVDAEAAGIRESLRGLRTSMASA